MKIFYIIKELHHFGVFLKKFSHWKKNWTNKRPRFCHVGEIKQYDWPIKSQNWVDFGQTLINLVENLVKEKKHVKYRCQIYENKNLKKEEVIDKTLVVEF